MGHHVRGCRAHAAGVLWRKRSPRQTLQKVVRRGRRGTVSCQEEGAEGSWGEVVERAGPGYLCPPCVHPRATHVPRWPAGPRVGMGEVALVENCLSRWAGVVAVVKGGLVPAPLKSSPSQRSEGTLTVGTGGPRVLWTTCSRVGVRRLCTLSLLLTQPLPVSICDSVVPVSRVNKARDAPPHRPCIFCTSWFVSTCSIPALAPSSSPGLGAAVQL